jgi:hypothetical protein
VAYDAQCEELACRFLDESASSDDVAGLSQAIQDTIEDWIESHQRAEREENA